MRLQYVDQNPKFDNEEEQAIVERMRQRRGDEGLLELDRTLLHAPPIADGWNTYLGAIRTRTTLSTAVRELAICRVAVLNSAWFEWDHHAHLLRAGDGITDSHLEAVLKTPLNGSSTVLDEQFGAVMAYTDAMTIGVKVPEAVFERLRQQFSEREIVEITATVASYNCVSRFLVALDVGERNGRTGPLP